MKTLFYSNGTNNIAKIIEKDLLKSVPRISADIVDSLSALSLKLRQPLNNISVIVALPDNHLELKGLIQMMPLLDNIKIILILPDRRRDTISLGTRLTPSFLSYIDNDAGDIISVLQKIKKNEQRPKIINGYKKTNMNIIDGDGNNEKKVAKI